jgi:hypothetical protein
MPKPKPKTNTRWRNTPDEILLARSTKQDLRRAESLCPTHATVERAALTDDPAARAIIDAWAFHAPVVRLI